MSTVPSKLRLVQPPKFGEGNKDDGKPRDVLKFERRRATRFAVGGRVTALSSDVLANGPSNRIS